MDIVMIQLINNAIIYNGFLTSLSSISLKFKSQPQTYSYKWVIRPNLLMLLMLFRIQHKDFISWYVQLVVLRFQTFHWCFERKVLSTVLFTIFPIGFTPSFKSMKYFSSSFFFNIINCFQSILTGNCLSTSQQQLSLLPLLNVKVRTGSTKKTDK